MWLLSKHQHAAFMAGSISCLEGGVEGTPRGYQGGAKGGLNGLHLLQMACGRWCSQRQETEIPRFQLVDCAEMWCSGVKLMVVDHEHHISAHFSVSPVLSPQDGMCPAGMSLQRGGEGLIPRGECCFGGHD